MQQVFNQLLQFVQQGISAIFKFVQLIWTWSVGEISKVVAVPWQNWPLWKQIFLVLVIAGVVWALYKAGKELLEAGERTLAAFAGLLGVLIKTLPHVVLAGLIALGGVWFLNSFDPSSIRIPTALRTGSG
jgi:phage-related protein